MYKEGLFDFVMRNFKIDRIKRKSLEAFMGEEYYRNIVFLYILLWQKK